MKKNITKDQKGFTIIEVLIVLAIAGLIILIVLLAVPALQRNSRNTQRKSDVSAILGGVNEYVTNHQGALPGVKADYSSNVKLGFYGDADITYAKNTTAFTTLATPNTSGVYVESFAKCNTTGDGLEASGSNVTSRNVVALYWTESSGGVTPQCQDI